MTLIPNDQLHIYALHNLPSGEEISSRTRGGQYVGTSSAVSQDASDLLAKHTQPVICSVTGEIRHHAVDTLAAIQEALDQRDAARDEHRFALVADKLAYEAKAQAPDCYVLALVEREAFLTIMQEEWGEICMDTNCHPLDITHGKGSSLFFSPNHWANAIYDRAMIAASQEKDPSLDKGPS